MAQIDTLTFASSPTPTTRGGRLPPHSIVAEESLIGAMLLSPEAVSVASEFCKAEDFYRPLHAQIFAAIVDLVNTGEAVDYVTVSTKLEERGAPSIEPSTLTSLQMNTPSASSAEHYATIVRDKAQQRRLIAAAGQITDEAYSATDDVDALIDDAERRINEIKDHRAYDSVSLLLPLLIDEMNTLETRGDNRGVLTGLATGYHSVDGILRGLQGSSLTIVGARPSVGKTAFALGILTHVGVTLRKPALFFSLEMSKNELAERILASAAGVDSANMKVGNLNDAEWTRATDAVGTLHDAPIFIDDNPHLTVMDVRARSRRIKQQQGSLGVVIIDYLQLMSSRSRSENRQVEVSEMSRGLKILARELDCPVIALSQLSRGIESRTGKDKRPIMSDLRESGSLEQDADVVIFLYRPELDDDAPINQGYLEVIVSKHRNGPTGTAKLAFRREFARFENMDENI